MSQILFILEGLDGCGKSRTAERMMRQVPDRWALLHAGKPTKTDPYEEYVVPLEGLWEAGYSVICDRWHLGEFVWPYIFEREPLKFHGLKEFEKEFTTKFDEIYVLFIDADPGFLVRDRVIEYDIMAARELYHEVAADTSLPVYISSHPDIAMKQFKKIMKGEYD